MANRILSKVARANLNRLANSLEASDHEWSMYQHETCALGQAIREFGLDCFSSRHIAAALKLPPDVAVKFFIHAEDENGMKLEHGAVTKEMMVDSLRAWALTGKARWVLG
jgi:hypothetical protein